MDIREALAEIARTNTAIFNLIARRFYPVAIVQGTGYPAVAYAIIDDPSNKDLKGNSSLHHARVQITIWDKRISVAADVSHAFKAAYVGYTGTINNVYIDRILHLDSRDDKEPEAAFFKIYDDYRVIYRYT